MVKKRLVKNSNSMYKLFQVNCVPMQLMTFKVKKACN